MRTKINIEPTNACNRRCAYCGDNKTRPVSFISPFLVNEILSQMPVIDEVRLFVSGEPFLHPRLDKIIKVCKDNNAEIIKIHTNGERIERRDAVKAVKAGLTHVCISYHSDEAERGVKAFRGLDVSVSLMRVVPHPDPLVNPLPEYKFDEVEIRRPHNWDVAGSVAGSDEIEGKKGSCRFPSSYLIVYANGDAGVCCADLNGKKILGNLEVDSLQTIDERLDEIVKKQSAGLSIPDLCDNCERY